MPTYEYECTKCGKQWELFQSIKAEPERKCPKCGRATARRKIGMGAAILGSSRSAARGGDAGEPTAAASTSGAAGKATEATPKSTAGGDNAGSGAGAAASASTPAAKASDEGKLNSTHPARDGRGAGNLRDAIARQRAAGAKKSAGSGTKKAAKAPRRGAR